MSGPLIGKFLPIWGIRIVYTIGIIVGGTSYVVFGVLQWVRDPVTILVLSYVIRFIEVEKNLKKREVNLI